MDLSGSVLEQPLGKKNVKVMGSAQVKPVAERLKEGVTLLRKILDLGIADTEPGYVAMKERVDAWIKRDEAWSGKADFVRYGRRAYVNLPLKAGCEATAVLKVWKY
jgi:hypothetical protein